MGIEWTKYSAETRQSLNAMIPDFGQISNPTDLTTAATGATGMFAAALSAISNDPAVDIVIPLFTINKRDDILAGAEIVRQSAKPGAVLWTGKCADDPEVTSVSVVRTGVPVYRDTLACLKAVRAAMDYSAFLARGPATDPAASRRPAGANPIAARKELDRTEGASLGEQASRALLAAYGFPVLRSELAADGERAAALAAEMGGNVVLKIDSPDIMHKTEAGGVHIGVSGPEQVRSTFQEIVAAARRHDPAARINGVLVQEMAAPGVELVLGGSCDATFGPIVTVGLGGIHVEIMRDVAHRIAPIDRDEARRMLSELKGFPILQGARGMEPRDVEAVVDLIVRLSWLMHDLGDRIDELDLNPVVVHEEGRGVQLLDALVLRRAAEG